MVTCKRGSEDFPNIEAARAALLDRGFEFHCYDYGANGQRVNEHFRHPDQQGDGCWQRADLFVPYGMTIGRVSFWPANA